MPSTTTSGFNPATSYLPTSSSTSSSTSNGINSLPNGQYDYLGIGSWAYAPDSNGVLQPAQINVGLTSGSGSYAQKRGDDADQALNNTPRNQYVTVNDLMNQFLQMSATSPNQWANVQSELYLAGFYSGKPTYGGAWSTADGNALSDAMRNFLAVQQSGADISFGEWLGNGAKAGLSAGGPGGGSGGSTRAPLQYTSSGTLDQVGNEEAQTELGRNLNSTEQAGFVSDYHGEESAAYNGGSENAGDPTAEAKQYIDKNNNAEMQTHLQADYAEKMLSMLGVQSG